MAHLLEFFCYCDEHRELVSILILAGSSLWCEVSQNLLSIAMILLREVKALFTLDEMMTCVSLVIGTGNSAV